VLSFGSLRARRGSVDILLAAFLFGTSGTARAYSSLSPVVAGATKTVLGGALLLALALRGGGLTTLTRPEGRRVWPMFAVGTVCVAIFQTAFYGAVADTGVAVGTVVTIGSAPAFAGLLSALSGHGRPSARWLVTTAGAVCGCALLVGGGQGAGVRPLGVLLALLSGFSYACYATITGRLICEGMDERAVVAVLFGGAGAVLLPFLLTASTGSLVSVSGVVVTVYLGVMVTALAYVLFARGLRTTPVTVATTLGLAEPAVAALLGLFVLGEHLGGVALGGLALMAVSLAAVR
jgi:DME family drug/metabolite transporter